MVLPNFGSLHTLSMTATFVAVAVIAMAAGVFSNTIPNVCLPNGSSNILVRFPHECFCDEYYECSDGEKVRKDCPAGQLFDQESGSCVPTDAADFSRCGGWQPPAKNCPPLGDTTLPHETNCNSYYRCKDGQKTLKQCRGGLLFDEQKGLCTWNTPSRCVPKMEYENPIADVPVCPPGGSNATVRLPHPCRCDLYYECVDGDAIYRECLEGLEFDYVRQICDDPTNFQCVRPIPPTTTTSTTPSTTTSTTTPSTTTSTTTPSTTTSTTTPSTTTSTTTPSTTTSTTTPSTTTSTTTPSTTTSTTTPSTTTSTTTPSTTTSTTTPSTTTSTTTPSTTTSTTTPSTTTSTTTTSTTTSTTTPSTTTSTTTPSTTTSTTTPSTTTSTTTPSTTTSTTTWAPPICPPDCTGRIRLPNPADCSSYYECYRGNRRLLWCATGLRFNKITQTCDWPWAVKC